MKNTETKKPAETKSAKVKVNTKSEKNTSKNTTVPTPKFVVSKKFVIFASVYLLLSMAVYAAFKYKGELIVATVNGKPITRIALWKALEKEGGSQSLDMLITQELIFQEAANKNITVSKEDVEAEIKNIETTLSAQGVTLEQVLSSQGVSTAQLEEQIKLQKMLEKLVEGNTVVTEDEVNTQVTAAVEAGQKDTPELREQIKTQLEQTKMSQEVQAYLTSVRSAAKINILNSNYMSMEQTPAQ